MDIKILPQCIQTMDNAKRIYIKIYYNPTVKIKTDNLKATRKWDLTTERSSEQDHQQISQQKHTADQKEWDDTVKVLKEKGFNQNSI